MSELSTTDATATLSSSSNKGKNGNSSRVPETPKDPSAFLRATFNPAGFVLKPDFTPAALSQWLLPQLPPAAAAAAPPAIGVCRGLSFAHRGSHVGSNPQRTFKLGSWRPLAPVEVCTRTCRSLLAPL